MGSLIPSRIYPLSSRFHFTSCLITFIFLFFYIPSLLTWTSYFLFWLPYCFLLNVLPLSCFLLDFCFFNSTSLCYLTLASFSSFVFTSSFTIFLFLYPVPVCSHALFITFYIYLSVYITSFLLFEHVFIVFFKRSIIASFLSNLLLYIF